MFSKNNKGIALIACYLVIVALTILGSAFLVRSISEKNIAERERDSIQAVYLAEAGLQDVIYQLYGFAFRDNVSEDADSPTVVNGVNLNYSAEVYKVSATDTYYLSSKGSAGGLTKEITQSMVVTVNPALEYALYVGKNIHAAQAEDFTIVGDYQENVTDLPTVDLSYYKGIAGSGQDISGNYTFTAGGTYSGLWYVDGNVTIESGVTFNGGSGGSIIATGNISMKDNSNITINTELPYPALAANGNFQFQNSSNITVNGVIYVGADMEGNFLIQQATNISFTGSVIVAGNLNVQQSSSITITYDASLAETPPQGFVTVTPQKDWNEI